MLNPFKKKKEPRRCETAKKVRKEYMKDTLDYLEQVKTELAEKKQVA